VQLTLGTRRVFWAFVWLWVFSLSTENPHSARLPLTLTVVHPIIFHSEKGTEMKTSLILASCLILTFLTACQSITPTPTTSTAASIPFSNEVVVSFIIGASDGMDDMSACLAANDIYRFVLYQDGRLIKFDGFQYVETRISQAEMDNFLSDIEATGFSSLSGDGDQYIENAPPPSFIDTWGGSVTVDEMTITVTPGQSDYLVEPVTKTLEIIENYKPANLQPYTPESVRLWVYLEENIHLGLANPTPEPPVLKWSVDEINLNDLLTDLASSKPKVISGETLSFVMGQVKHIPVVRRVEQNRQNYLVVVCPNFA
jgi:hypothetical protein